MTDIMVRAENSPLVKRWTREACLRMEQIGLLQPPYELVEGAVNLMGQNIRHASAVRLLLYWLFAMFGKDFVLTQTSIDVAPEDNPTSEPMPDAIVLARPVDTLTDNPRPDEIRLLIEVSDSTLAYDLTTKAGLYARAGISEYWIVDLPERKLHIHRAPRSGTYGEVAIVAETETATVLGDADIAVQVSELLPPIR
jgi:hypothetical protein